MKKKKIKLEIIVPAVLMADKGRVIASFKIKKYEVKSILVEK